MTESPERFAELLTHAIRQTKRVENNKPMRVIQDELGYALGREGGSAVEYWRKGNLPPGRQDVEELARLLVRRGRLEREWLKNFLESGGCGLSTATLEAQLFGNSTEMVAADDAEDELPTPATVTAPPFQAPMITPYFVGRHTALAQLQQWLTRKKAPCVVALVGMGGVGKTALAVQTANVLRTHFPDGVLWAYTAVSEPLDIVNSWARAYGYDFSGLSDIHSRTAALRGVLANKRTLVVLDDVTSAARVQPLLPGGDACAVLLTTRSEDIAVALRADVIRLGELALVEGFELLTKILGQERVHAEAAAGRTICELLHQLPLAVEIAGQLLAARSRRRLSDMARHLHHVQHRLDLQISDRHVRTSFLVSWDALDAAQRQIFAHLAVFAGRPFTPDALAAVAVIDRYRAQEQLFTLEALSLITEDDGECYRQHPLLADFAAEQLRTNAFGDETAARKRLAVYFHAFATQHQQEYTVLEPQWDNLMAGMETAYALEEWQLVLAYAEALTEPWFTRARYPQARQGYAWAVAAAIGKNDEMAIARYRVKWGYACAQQNDYAEAATHLAQAIQWEKPLAADQVVADAQHHLARIAVEHNHYERADELLADCLALRIRLGDQVGIAKTMYQRAILLFRMGDYEQCSQLGQQALAIQEQAEKTLDILETLRLLTECALASQDHTQAASLAQRAMALSQRSSYQTEFAEACFSLAVVHRRLNEVVMAWTYAEQSRQLFEQMGIRSFLSYALYEESKIKLLQNDYAQALALGQQSLAIMSTLNDDFNRVYCLKHLGQIYKQLGELATAQTVWREAEKVAIAIHHPITNQFAQLIAALTELAVH